MIPMQIIGFHRSHASLFLLLLLFDIKMQGLEFRGVHKVKCTRSLHYYRLNFFQFLLRVNSICLGFVQAAPVF